MEFLFWNNFKRISFQHFLDFTSSCAGSVKHFVSFIFTAKNSGFLEASKRVLTFRFLGLLRSNWQFKHKILCILSKCKVISDHWQVDRFRTVICKYDSDQSTIIIVVYIFLRFKPICRLNLRKILLIVLEQDSSTNKSETQKAVLGVAAYVLAEFLSFEPTSFQELLLQMFFFCKGHYRAIV